MGFHRTVSVLTTFGVLCSVSIYWSYLQDEINGFNVYQQKEQDFIYKNDTNVSQVIKDETEIYSNSTMYVPSQCENCTNHIHTESYVSISNSTTNPPKKRQIWITMGLCFTKNTEMYGKKDYPYTSVTPLSIILWYHFFPDIRIILYLISTKYEIEDRKILYEETLKQTNVEIRWVEEDDVNCVTKSQLIRMWAFQEPMIKDEDILITVDVNLFPDNERILNPIFDNPNLKIWVFQWFDTASIEGGIGETFNQNLIAAEAKGRIISISGIFVAD